MFDADVARPGQFTPTGGRDDIQRLVAAAAAGFHLKSPVDEHWRIASKPLHADPLLALMDELLRP